MDSTVAGPVSHLRDGAGDQVIQEGAGHSSARNLLRTDERNMTREEAKRGNNRKTFTIVVLVLVVAAIYIGSFFLVTG